MRYIVIWAVALMATHVALGQQTVRYWEPEKVYKDGLELFAQKDFVHARALFHEVLTRSRPATDPKIKTIMVNAEYYRALSALKLLNPDGEHLMLAFLNHHTGNAHSNRAYFYLGDYYYRKKQYRSVVEYHEKVDPFELTPAEKTDYRFQLAYGYFFDKSFDKARPLFAQVMNTEKYYFPAHYYHGFIAFLSEDYETALNDFKKVEKDPYFGRVVPFYIASIYFQQRDYASLTEYARPLLNDRSIKYYAEINQLVGKAYFEQKQYENALPLLMYYAESARRMSKEDIYQLGYTQYQLKEYEAAIENFEQLSREKDSLGHHAVYLLGDCYLKTGNLNKAFRAFQEAAEMKYDPFIREHAMINFAKTAYELGVHDNAIAATRYFIKNYPNSSFLQEARELLTDLFLSTRNYEEAISTIEAMGSLSPTLKKAYQKVTFYRGVELMTNGNLKEAKTLFNKSLQHPIDVDIQAQAYFWKGEIALQQSDFMATIGDYRKFKDLQPMTRSLPVNTSVAAADYGIGYAYFQQASYQSAVRYFEDAQRGLQKLSTSGPEGTLRQSLLPDATLRLADCQFMLKQYQSALANYKTVTSEKWNDADYALYQQGMLHGVLDQNKAKQRAMLTLTRNYPKSFYYDDALFQLASTYLLENNRRDAIRTFDQLIAQNPRSPYVIQALMKIALIYYQEREDQKAITYYTRVTEDYPGTEEAREALAQIKRISLELGDPSIYVNLSGANVSEQDTLQFRTAENFYFQEKYDRALQELTEYIDQFPDGYFITTAHYYRGDCYYRKEEYRKALPDYEFVINASNNQAFEEVSYLRAAKINHYVVKDSVQAFDYYKPLLDIATLPQTKFDALQSLMHLAYHLQYFKEAKDYANQMLQSANATREDRLNAHFILGMIHFEEGVYDEAMTHFTRVKEQTTNLKGVQSRYYMAKIHFLREEYALAEAQCDDIIRNYPGYEYWLIKSLILVSDIYYEQEEFFQAKATLESIVNSYTGDPQLLAEAQEKLDRVLQAMDENSRIKGPEDDPFNNPEEPKNSN